MNFNKLIERVRLLLTTPKTEWPVIAAEPATVGGLYTGYILLLAAVPALCTFVSSIAIGIVRLSAGAALGAALFGYVISLIGVYLLGLIINALAPTFSAQKDSIQAFKTSAYAYTAAWVAGVGMLIPFLGVLLALVGGVYSIYLLYLGLPHTMKCPPEKAAGYTAVTVVIAIVIMIIMGAISGTMLAPSLMGGVAGSGLSGSSTTFDKDSALGKLEAMGQKMEAASQKLEAAQKSGSSEQQSEAMGQMLGAVLGGASGSAEALPPDRLKAFVPDTLGGLARTELAAERNGALGIQVATANGRYTDGSGRELRLEITDSGGAAGLMGLASWAMMEQERETDSGFERTRKEDGRMVHEEWNRNSNSGEYSVVLGERFVVKLAGAGGSVEDLKSALGSLNLAGLEALKNEGVKPN